MLSDPAEKISALGAMVWLLMHSTLHKGVTTRVLMRNTIPPIALKQYVIIYDDGYPVAYVSWAFFSAESERKYIHEPSMLDPKDWNSGERLWFIDFISPFSYRHTVALKSWLKKNFPGRYARALRVKPDDSVGKIHTYAGSDLPDDWKDGADQEILAGFIKITSEPISETSASASVDGVAAA